jgi:glycosyltransferase involved in cell wall biosynthesis
MPRPAVQRELSTRPRSDTAAAPLLNCKPRRVCMVTYSFYETDSRAMRYAEALCQRGDEVEVFALRRPGTSSSEAIAGVRVYRLQGRVFNERSPLTHGYRILFFLLRALVGIARHDLRRKYDLVHVLSVPDFLVLAALGPRLRGTPVILDIRDILPEFYVSKFQASRKSLGFRLLCWIERWCARFSSHVIVAGTDWQARLLSRSVQPGRSTVILNVPDRSIFKRTSPSADSTSKKCLLLYHGTLNWHQGLDIAVMAFARIKDRVPDTKFHIYGDGSTREELLALIQQYQLGDQVAVYDRKPVREIVAVLETAQLGIVPKRKDDFGNEAFSTKILEFMAMGVPVVVSDTKVDKAYFDATMVRFFRGESVEDLAECMLDLICHPEKRRALAEQASQFVSKNDWAARKQEYLDLVDRLSERYG